jgi:hypothetical protein
MQAGAGNIIKMMETVVTGFVGECGVDKDFSWGEHLIGKHPIPNRGSFLLYSPACYQFA